MRRVRCSDYTKVTLTIFNWIQLVTIRCGLDLSWSDRNLVASVDRAYAKLDAAIGKMNELRELYVFRFQLKIDKHSSAMIM